MDDDVGEGEATVDDVPDGSPAPEHEEVDDEDITANDVEDAVRQVRVRSEPGPRRTSTPTRSPPAT